MKKTLIILANLLTISVLFISCNNQPDTPTPEPEPEDSSYVFPTDRWVGGDISLLPSYEAVNTPYKDAKGKTISNVLTYVHDSAHWNAARVRLFVNPVIINPDDNNHQGEVQDLEYVKKLGKRIKDAGMTFMLDFHYSDTWADPTKQTIPAAWQSIAQGQPMADKVYAYTKECLTALVAAGATPDFIQVGNEISYGMLWSRKGQDMVAPNSPYEDYQANWEKLSL